MNSQEKRLADNQRAFRIGNERLRRALERRAGDKSIPFLCECVDDTCVARIDLTLEEYDGIRTHENRFVIIRNHPKLSGERIVQENASYQVVEE